MPHNHEQYDDCMIGCPENPDGKAILEDEKMQEEWRQDVKDFPHPGEQEPITNFQCPVTETGKSGWRAQVNRPLSAADVDKDEFVDRLRGKVSIVLLTTTLNTAMDLVSALHLALDEEASEDGQEEAREALLTCLRGARLHSAQAQRVK